MNWDLLLNIVVIGPVVIVLVFAISRAASWGYFKSKKEHFDQIWKQMKEESNGTEK